MKEIDLKATGENITRLRNASGMSVKEVQKKIGFSTSMAVYKWQYGRTLPTVDNLVRLADLFNVKMDDIIITREI